MIFIITLIKNATLEVKKSKFIAYYYKIDNQEEVDIVLTNVKKEHKKAKHIPYAYKIGNIIFKTDDKEPSNTAGTPLYNLIINRNLDNVLLVVVRYFGGIKLGIGLLTRSYLNSAKMVLENNN